MTPPKLTHLLHCRHFSDHQLDVLVVVLVAGVLVAVPVDVSAAPLEGLDANPLRPSDLTAAVRACLAGRLLLGVVHDSDRWREKERLLQAPPLRLGGCTSQRSTGDPPSEFSIHSTVICSFFGRHMTVLIFIKDSRAT